MAKRVVALIMIIAVLGCFGCKGAPAAEAEAEVVPDTAAAPEPAAQEYELGEKLGMIIDDDGSMGAYMSIYGFLHTAEILGYPAKLFRAQAGEASVSAVDAALAEGVCALLIMDRNGANDSAVTRAVSYGMDVVVPYYECGVQGIASNVVADTTEYVEEVCRGLATRLTERSLKSGRILIYGDDTSVCYNEFVSALAAYFPQYTAVCFDRTAQDDELAVEELADFILNNRDVKGMYVVDTELASIAVSARSKAQSVFRTQGAPTPTPTQAPALSADPLITPEVTPNPGLLTAITITIFASGLSDDNYKLFSDNDIYGLCIEPYYEVCTQSTMYLDKLVKGDEVALNSRVNRPIAYADTIEKYTVIFDTVKELFNVNVD